RCTRPPVRLLNHAPLAADHYCREGGRPRPSRRMLEPPPPPPGPMTGAALITGPDQTFRRFDGDHRATGGRAGRTTGLGLPVAITLVAVLVAGAVGAMAIPSGPAKAADLRLSLSPGRVLHYPAHPSMVARVQVGDTWTSRFQQAMPTAAAPIAYTVHSGLLRYEQHDGTRVAVLTDAVTLPMHLTFDLPKAGRARGAVALAFHPGDRHPRISVSGLITAVQTAWLDPGTGTWI